MAKKISKSRKEELLLKEDHNNDVLSVESEMDVSTRWSSLHTEREVILDRYRECSYLTIPYILPEDWVTQDIGFASPHQTLGARGVNNLSNKLLLTLFPPNTPFFKLQVSEAIIQDMENDGATDIEQEIEARLSEQEQIIQSEMEISAFRPELYEAIRHLVVTGNYCLHIPKDGTPVGYALDRFVVRRSHNGKVLELIIKENISASELPDKWLAQIESETGLLETSLDGRTKSIPIYTRVIFKDKKYHEAKYVKNIKLEGSEATYPEDANAWLVLRWVNISGQNYGRSYVEEYLGGFRTLEGLTLALKKHSAIASKAIGLIREGSRLKASDLASVASGGFVYGNPEDVQFLQLGKYNDMQVVGNMVDGITQDLSRVFLLTQVRQAERVTAEEIRLLANELETALGGAYSLLSKTFQEPLLMRLINRLQKAGKLATISNEDIKPKIIVGIEGLSRGTDLNKLMNASASIAQLAQMAQAIPNLKMDNVTKFVFNAVGLDMDGLFKTEEEILAEQQAQQAQQAQMQQAQIAKSALTGVGSTIVDNSVEHPEEMSDLTQNFGSAMQQQQQ